MAVVIDINKAGEKSYKSANWGIISDEERAKADELDDLIKKKINIFIQKNNLKDIKKNRFYYYWELGKILRVIYYDSGLVDKDEKELFFKNVRLHMNNTSNIFPKDDKKRNRNYPKLFFKLAGYPYNVAKKVEWSYWIYLFENKYLVESTGFDDWFIEKLKSDKNKFTEGFTRLWAESFNLLFKKVDLSDWTEEEKIKPIYCTFDIIQALVDEGVNIESREVRRSVKSSIITVLKENRKEFVFLQMGKISSKDYIDLISSQILALYEKKMDDRFYKRKD